MRRVALARRRLVRQAREPRQPDHRQDAARGGRRDRGVQGPDRRGRLRVVAAAGQAQVQGRLGRSGALPRAAARRRVKRFAAVVLVLAGCGGSQQQATVPKHPERQVPHAKKTVKEVKHPASKPKGVMLIFSGGAWLAPPPTEVSATRHYQQRYADLGW